MKYKMPILESDRLVLKKGTYEDFVKVYEYDFTRLRNIDGEFEFVKYDKELLKDFDVYASTEDNVLDFILYLKDDMIPIGNILYDRYDEKNNSLEVSVNLHPSYWRRGYMFEGLLCSMKYVFDNLEIDNIIYGYALDNYKSKGLSEKIGFQFYYDFIEHYIRIDKDIKEVKTIMSKEKFKKLYGNKLR